MEFIPHLSAVIRATVGDNIKNIHNFNTFKTTETEQKHITQTMKIKLKYTCNTIKYTYVKMTIRNRVGKKDLRENT